MRRGVVRRGHLSALLGAATVIILCSIAYTQFRNMGTLVVYIANADQPGKATSEQARHLQLPGKTQSLTALDDADLIAELMDVLRSGEIEHCEPYHRGLSEKYVCVLQGGFQATMKVFERQHLLSSRPLHSISWDELEREEQKRISRAQWEYQGWSEVAAWHVNEVLAMLPQPPVASRFVPVEVLWANEDSWRAWLYASRSWIAEASKRLLRAIAPSTSWLVKGVPVSVHAWIDEMRPAPPDVKWKPHLTSLARPLPEKHKELLLSYSDKTLLDFIIDNHDGNGPQNFRALRSGTLTMWDNGLSWRHGPTPRTSCEEILCVSAEFKPLYTNCYKLTVFRNATVTRLRELNEHRHSSDRFSNRVRASMEVDNGVSPFFYAVYHRDTNALGWSDFGKTRILVEDFYRGLDVRLKKALSYIDRTVEEHGREATVF